jgi:O-antigen/teichoic acid export membrane protein
MDEQLKQQTKKGVFWSAMQRFSTQGLQFITTLFLARLLTPADYGVVSMLGVFIAICSVFVDGGFINALTRKQDRTHADICTVFFFNIGVAALAYCLLFAIAPLVAAFYNMPELRVVLRVLGIAMIINSFASVQVTLLTINLDFKTQTPIAIVTIVISATVAIICAWMGLSYWALVIQNIVYCIVNTSLYWHFSKWRPTLVFSRKSFNEMFGFGSKILATQFIDTIYSNLYSLVIGKAFSASALGSYDRANSYANFPSNSLTGVMQRVTYPVLCRMQGNDGELAWTYRKFLKLSAFVIFPLMMGLSALAYPFIILIIGYKWTASAAMLQVICFGLMWFPINSINLNLLMVKGRSDLTLRVEVIKKIIGVLLLFGCVPLGIMALCYSVIVASVLAVVINTYYTGKLIGLGFFKQMKDLLPTFAISVSMWGVILLVNSHIASLPVQMGTGFVVGAVYYIGVSYLFNREEFNSVLSLMRNKR